MFIKLFTMVSFTLTKLLTYLLPMILNTQYVL